MSNTIGRTDDGAGKCPVDFKTRSLWSLLGVGKPGSVTDGQATASASSTATLANGNAIPASLEEAARHAQTPQPGQRLPLSTHRLESTIPRQSDSQIPGHQIQLTAAEEEDANAKEDDPNTTWVYPSEQQVFNAMKRKGWKGIEEESIPSFLQIHNSVNERSWQDVLEWEELAGHSGESVELSRFEGRPTDLTPKAWLLSTLGITDKPFDRHDWYVVNKDNNKDNHNTNEKRYVLDFYMTESSSNSGTGTGLPKVEIDVRPAIDGPEALFQRGAGMLREVFPGIARELDERLKQR